MSDKATEERMRYWAAHPAGQVEPMHTDLLNAADELERLERERSEWAGVAATRNLNNVLMAEDRDRLRDALREIAGYLGPLDFNAEQMRNLARETLRTARGPNVPAGTPAAGASSGGETTGVTLAPTDDKDPTPPHLLKQGYRSGHT